ncbi:MAG TPA: phosphotransferase [Gammaproteobacteria bacterium]|nr:phosphotransferase [Gammaproteobacteria bacterium]
MNDTTALLAWGADCLIANGHPTQSAPENVVSTPWSTMLRFRTSNGDFYLKQTPPSISTEPQIIKLLADKFHASVPVVIDSNDKLHCFLMRDAGQVLRATLKTKFDVELLCRAIEEYAALQRSTENDVNALIRLGVPDWRLDKLPELYDQLISKVYFLKADSITDEELQNLHDLRPHVDAQCKLLASYEIPETIGIPDFNDNNTLLDHNTQKLTFIDWGESSITHPFFSLYNCLEQAIKHHGVKDGDKVYSKLQDACLTSWLESSTKKQLLDAFNLSKQLWHIYGALGCYRLMVSVDLQALNKLYADKPNRLATALRKYIACCT